MDTGPQTELAMFLEPLIATVARQPAGSVSGCPVADAATPRIAITPIANDFTV
jgi:hypothetical protein